MVRRAAPVEIVPGRLYAVGGTYPLDGRVSWAPADATGHQPSLGFLLLREDGPLVVDPGLPVVARQVVEGLRALLPPDAAPRVFLTRPQFDCVGNVGAVFEAFPNAILCSDAQSNYFDAFDSLLALSAGGTGRAAMIRPPAASGLEIIVPMLHLLHTLWGYDAETRTLFTSDSFTHAVLDEPGARPVVDSPDGDAAGAGDVEAHLHATHPWLAHARTEAIVADLRTIFAEREIETIAPNRGCALHGEAVVERHLELVCGALARAGAVAA